MNKLNTFFYSFKNSITNPAYYRDIVKTPFSFSWKYLYFLSLLIVLVGFIKFIIVTSALLPQLPPKIQEFKKGLQTAYPAELELQIKNGTLETNVENPYFIDPAFFKDDEAKAVAEHFITIDTEASVEKYEEYNTLVLLTKNAAVYPDNNNGLETYRVTNFKEFKDPFTLNKKIYDGFVAQVNPFLDSLPRILTILLFLSILLSPLVALAMTGWYMFYLLFATIIPWIVSKLFKNNLTYGKIYQLSMHALTVPLFITFMLELFEIKYNFLFTAIYFLWMAIILSKLGSEKEAKEVIVEEKTV